MHPRQPLKQQQGPQQRLPQAHLHLQLPSQRFALYFGRSTVHCSCRFCWRASYSRIAGHNGVVLSQARTGTAHCPCVLPHVPHDET